MASKDPAECMFLSPIVAERYLTCPERRLATSDCTSVKGGSGPLYGLNGICVISQSETKPVAAATVNARMTIRRTQFGRVGGLIDSNMSQSRRWLSMNSAPISERPTPAAQKTSTYPCLPPPPHQRIPPSFRRKFDRPMSRFSPDRDCADYFSNCHTRQWPADASPPSGSAALPACSSAANGSDSSHAAILRCCHRHALGRTRSASPADACAETGLAASRHWAACPRLPRENYQHPVE